MLSASDFAAIKQYTTRPFSLRLIFLSVSQEAKTNIQCDVSTYLKVIFVDTR